jgi:hypothetical protein
MATLTLDQTTCEKIQCGAIPASVLNDPANIQPNGLPLRAACSAAGWAGPSGGRFCSDPVCTPWKDLIMASGWGQGLECCVQAGGTWGADGTCTMPTAAPMPTMTTTVMPSITDTANTAPPPVAPTLTPTILTQKMPSIVNPAPAVVSAPVCPNGFASWINDNPVLAMVGLAGLAYLLLGKK